jgi:hypothetical protein
MFNSFDFIEINLVKLSCNCSCLYFGLTFKRFNLNS